ncbi:MAG: biopolymer transporter ExbD [Deltaproteobacteria bacterium]|nr:biopolymer transporter ExbD [Deltaproteobacteria bacterium]
MATKGEGGQTGAGDGGGHEETPATMGQVKAIIRGKLRKQEEEMEMGLNIYPMMDMMTILLVFLIMQFASSVADTMQSDELRLPYSTSETVKVDALTVKISRNAIIVQDREVLTLRNGQIDAADKQGGGTGFLVTRLDRELQQHKERLKQIASLRGQNFRGEVQIIADQRTPFRTLTEVIYTLGRSEFKNLRFVVLQEGS